MYFTLHIDSFPEEIMQYLVSRIRFLIFTPRRHNNFEIVEIYLDGGNDGEAQEEL